MSETQYTHLVGRVGRDIERVATKTGKSLGKFSLAVETGYDTEKREAITTWYDVAVWDDLCNALFAGTDPVILKGARVWVAGKTSVYAGESGDKMQISAREVGLVERFLVGKAGAAPIIIDEVGLTVEEAAEMDGISDEW